jgi:hypothetical protein
LITEIVIAKSFRHFIMLIDRPAKAKKQSAYLSFRRRLESWAAINDNLSRLKDIALFAVFGRDSIVVNS